MLGDTSTETRAGAIGRVSALMQRMAAFQGGVGAFGRVAEVVLGGLGSAGLADAARELQAAF